MATPIPHISRKRKRPHAHAREKSVSEVWLERQRDSTVMAQSLAQSKPQSFRKMGSFSPLQTTMAHVASPTIELLDSQKLPLYDLGGDHELLGEKHAKHESQSLNNMISNDRSIYGKTGDEHFVAVSNESYLSELFLKQPIVLRLKYVSLGPFARAEWSDKAVSWKLRISVKRDFEYLDAMRCFDFARYREVHGRLRFCVADNVHGARTSLALNGNICFEILRCRSRVDGHGADEGGGEDSEKMIGSVWIHSHFVPAAYEHKIDTLSFAKHDIDYMYKDKKHKTSIPPSFTLQIGYRCSRISVEDEEAGAAQTGRGDIESADHRLTAMI